MEKEKQSAEKEKQSAENKRMQDMVLQERASTRQNEDKSESGRIA